MRGLKDRIVLVTGGANGIGAAIARRLAEEGCVVGILDKDAAGGEGIANEIKTAGGRASVHTVDITDYDAVVRAVESFEAASGPVACLVNNAGWDRAASFLDTTPEFWRSCDAVADRASWRIWGLPNCGKGDPMQTMRVAHGAPAARFRNVEMG